MIDHTNSPGMTPQQVTIKGPVVGAGQKFEAPLYVCGHCQSGIVIHPLRNRPIAWCGQCSRRICNDCERARNLTGECLFGRLLDLAEKSK